MTLRKTMIETILLLSDCVVSENITAHPEESHWGVGFQTKVPSMVGVWVFSGMTYFSLVYHKNGFIGYEFDLNLLLKFLGD